MLDSILPIYIMIVMNVSILGQSKYNILKLYSYLLLFVLNIGFVFLPMTFSLFVTESVFGWLSYKIGR